MSTTAVNKRSPATGTVLMGRVKLEPSEKAEIAEDMAAWCDIRLLDEAIDNTGHIKLRLADCAIR